MLSFWRNVQVRWLSLGHNPIFTLVLCIDDARVYGYVRFETGDEMSRRAKFAFITWIGTAVSPLKKAKVSTDKAFLKEIMNVSTLPSHWFNYDFPFSPAIRKGNSGRREVRFEVR